RAPARRRESRGIPSRESSRRCLGLGDERSPGLGHNNAILARTSVATQRPAQRESTERDDSTSTQAAPAANPDSDRLESYSEDRPAPHLPEGAAVPSTRLSCALGFAALGAGLAAGTAAELARWAWTGCRNPTPGPRPRCRATRTSALRGDEAGADAERSGRVDRAPGADEGAGVAGGVVGGGVEGRDRLGGSAVRGREHRAGPPGDAAAVVVVVVAGNERAEACSSEGVISRRGRLHRVRSV
ncbi:hypothetical protein ACHAWF_006546, partial [Thalassiosira exigua]